MNNSGDKPKSLPPDDFSATVPNINIPHQDFSDHENEGGNDWEKTNYNFSVKESKSEDWSKTAYNIPTAGSASAPPPTDFDKTFTPGTQPPPPANNYQKDADWGMTQANIKIPSNQPPQQRPAENYSSHTQTEYNATTPLIKLPEYERQKYQNLPPATVAEEEENKKGGIPIWGWILGVLFGAALFAILLIAGVWYFFFPNQGFDVVVSNAPPGSDIRVNGATWNIRAEGGNYRLLNLKPGEKKIIEIKKEGVSCKPIEVTGKSGEPQTIIADCPQTVVAQKPVVTEGCDPSKFSSKDIQKSHDCAYEKLRALTPDFTVQQLLEAMNLYIINFDSGKFNIKPDDAKFLQEAANFMKKLPPNVEIEVGGHTDNKGTGNQALSNNRANAVRQALITAGVNKEILLTRGYAETRPKDTNDTEDGRFRNRRIEYSAIIR